MGRASDDRYDRYPELTALRRYRVKQNFTYRELALLTGISYRTLHDLINGRHPRPYARTLYRVRAFLERQAAKPRRARNVAREVTL